MPEHVRPQEAVSTAASSRADDALIRLVNVHKRFGPLRVLEGVDLSLQRGKVTVILGPSGTGKSVLLKHIVGLIRPDRGEVWFGNQRVDTMDESDLVNIRRRIGFLFQMSALFDSMSVGTNIKFPLIEHPDIPRSEIDHRCARVLSMVGLEGIGDKMPASLSGGQRKRVALARAIVLEPQVVLYDEPTTGLDPIRADLINELIIQLNRRLGITSIVVTHDIASATKIADRMVMLYDGQVVADGDPESFRSIDNELVQRFIQGRADEQELRAIQAPGNFPGNDPSSSAPAGATSRGSP